MMGGLAYMTGLPDRPMRVGASVNDVMGGMFGVIAIQAALAERQATGRGRYIQSALFENNVFLMGQAMMFETVTGTPSIPYSVKDSPWPVYDLFDTKDGSKLFVTIVGEEQWEAFCRTFGTRGLARRSAACDHQGRVDQRAWMIPEIADDLPAMAGRGARRDAGAAGSAVRAGQQARRSVRRSAPRGVRRAARHPAAGRARRQDAGAAGLDRRRAARQPARSAAHRRAHARGADRHRLCCRRDRRSCPSGSDHGRELTGRCAPPRSASAVRQQRDDAREDTHDDHATPGSDCRFRHARRRAAALSRARAGHDRHARLRAGHRRLCARHDRGGQGLLPDPRSSISSWSSATPARTAARRSPPGRRCSRTATPAIRCSSPRAARNARSSWPRR